MALKVFALPDLGEGLDEAEIIDWHVRVGDRVVADQPLVSVETGKALVEIPAPWGGTVAALHAAPGDTVRVGAPLVGFETVARTDAGAIVGELDTAPPPAAPGAEPKTRPQPQAEAPLRAMPAARALARRQGIDLAGVAGTGPGGVIQRADIAAATAARDGWAALSAPRQAMARAMAAAQAQVVRATVQDWADVSGWFGPKADVLMRLVRALAVAARAEPALNAWFDAATMTRRVHDHVDLGIAVDTSAGLYVPVLRDAGALSGPQLRAELDRLIAAARAPAGPCRPASAHAQPVEFRGPGRRLRGLGRDPAAGGDPRRGADRRRGRAPPAPVADLRPPRRDRRRGRAVPAGAARRSAKANMKGRSPHG